MHRAFKTYLSLAVEVDHVEQLLNIIVPSSAHGGVGDVGGPSQANQLHISTICRAPAFVLAATRLLDVRPENRLSNLSTRAVGLFVLHGMLSTNIQLDDFTSTLLRFLGRLLSLKGRGGFRGARKWVMMG